jgi:hypothetical protein
MKQRVAKPLRLYRTRVTRNSLQGFGVQASTQRISSITSNNLGLTRDCNLSGFSAACANGLVAKELL